ncbi:tetratricopeptide (TPR) repeat protein [Algoriphagus sp. 4150]|uniref:RagB/SusD family nutrient uptake outer membrane protein n=1 Tax=Algoriphagus sp. 4150 TaxID=2817756 RepID=UPI00285FAA38|nr:RagB/SusD family nutrient uptake outer membrane protein [Algoriphagus sp. 4150]MDR7131664.1 tetratricopeptide (TPR) repeat protein [Algoriphagus sp. 4150]
MRISAYYLFLLIALLLSCEGFLDEKPQKQMVIPNTLDDFQALLDAEPRSMNSVPKMGFLSSDELFIDNSLLGQMTLEERGAYLWQPDLYLPNDAGVDWAFSYRKVFYANLVIEGVRDYSPNSQEEKNRALQLDAAARFYRAFAHFSLVQEFAEPFNPQKPEAQGIPLRKNADINATSERVSIGEVYNFVIEDLEVARELLPNKADIPTRASKWAAEALLSRIYLSIQNYEKAMEHSSNALEIDDSLMDYNDWDSGLRYSFPRFNAEVIHHAHMFTGRFTSSTQTYVNPELYDLYDSLDLRKEVFFRASSTPGLYNVYGKYTGESTMYGGMATDEVLLDRAESAVRMGQREIALTDLNYLLMNRYVKGAFEAYQNLNEKELLKIIMEERRKELVFRGVRWLDLRRYNQETEYAETLNRKWNEVDTELPPHSPLYTFPIPPRENELNDKL